MGFFEVSLKSCMTPPPPVIIFFHDPPNKGIFFGDPPPPTHTHTHPHTPKKVNLTSCTYSVSFCHYQGITFTVASVTFKVAE